MLIIEILCTVILFCVIVFIGSLFFLVWPWFCIPIIVATIFAIMFAKIERSYDLTVFQDGSYYQVMGGEYVVRIVNDDSVESIEIGSNFEVVESVKAKYEIRFEQNYDLKTMSVKIKNYKLILPKEAYYKLLEERSE